MTEFITRKKLASYRNLCRQDHATIFAFAESGKTITDYHIDNVLSQYRDYLLKMKVYAMDRRREIKHKEKMKGKSNESANSGGETGKRKKLSHCDDVASTS
jgi:hypothetical protein